MLFPQRHLLLGTAAALWCYMSLVQQPVWGLPVGFVDEGIGTLNGPNKAVFAPNPRNLKGSPMMMVAAKEGQIVVFEDPDNSDVKIQIANMNTKICTNGPRGVYSIIPHPDFATNRFLYIWYTNFIINCPTDPILGPRNRLSRFTLNATSLEIMMNTEVVLLQTPPSPILLHDGGAMFISRERHIYVAIGDGGDVTYGQDLRNLYGKLIRLELNGTVPSTNPYTAASGGKGVNCRSNGGRPPNNAPLDAVCEESYAYGLRNPFRLGVDPNTVDKVKFAIADVGNAIWEEISFGGTDYKGTNYGFGIFEGPCKLNTWNDCPIHPVGYTEPFYYYIHSPTGGAATGSVFIPNGLWPAQYKYMFIEYIEGKIVSLTEDPSVGCRACIPPRPYYRNETFHRYDRMTDVFFGPYQNTQAMYYLSRNGAAPNIRRIRYVGGTNFPPNAVIYTVKKAYAINEVITLYGSNSTDSENMVLSYLWKFGDGRTSTLADPTLSYSTLGTKAVELAVTDALGLISKAFINIVIGVAPTASFESPTSTTQFSVGDIIRLKGRGTDLSTKTQIPNTQKFWEVNIRHATHYHPFMQYQSGDNITLFPAPAPEDFMAATNSFLRVFYTVVDSNGISTTIRRDIMPRKVFIDVDSNPRGLNILIGNFNVKTPMTITTWQNQVIKLEALDQAPYVFQSWNVGGPRVRTYLVPPLNTTNPKIMAEFL
jgi:Glucose / Sorbosone dehydrogenase/PKD domain